MPTVCGDSAVGLQHLRHGPRGPGQRVLSRNHPRSTRAGCATAAAMRTALESGARTGGAADPRRPRPGGGEPARGVDHSPTGCAPPSSGSARGRWPSWPRRADQRGGPRSGRASRRRRWAAAAVVAVRRAAPAGSARRPTPARIADLDTPRRSWWRATPTSSHRAGDRAAGAPGRRGRRPWSASAPAARAWRRCRGHCTCDAPARPTARCRPAARERRSGRALAAARAPDLGGPHDSAAAARRRCATSPAPRSSPHAGRGQRGRPPPPAPRRRRRPGAGGGEAGRSKAVVFSGADPVADGPAAERWRAAWAAPPRPPRAAFPNAVHHVGAHSRAAVAAVEPGARGQASRTSRAAPSACARPCRPPGGRAGLAGVPRPSARISASSFPS